MGDTVCPRWSRALGPTFEAVHVHYAVARLTKVGAVMEAVPGVSSPRIAFWRELGIDAALAETRLADAEVEVVDLADEAADHSAGQGSDSSTEQVVVALSRCGVPTRSRSADDVSLDGSEEGSPTVRVVLVADYLQPELAELNASALRSRRPWMLVKPLGRQLWVGPVFRPGVSGCWECLAQRLRGNRDVAGYLVERAGWRRRSRWPRCISRLPARWLPTWPR